MRLVIFVILAAILLVTIICDASSTTTASTSSPKKDKGTKNNHKHHKKHPTTTTSIPSNPLLAMTSLESPHQSPALNRRIEKEDGFADLTENRHHSPAQSQHPKPKKAKTKPSSEKPKQTETPLHQSDIRKNRGKKLRDWASRNKRIHRELLHLLAQGDGVTDSQTLECCPSVVEMVEPLGGINMAGHHVELYRQGEIGQRFYERSCEADFLGANKPCRFVDSKLKKVSRCVQKYSYSYALVRDSFSETNYRLDYIKIRSGCACEIVPPLLGPELQTHSSNSTVR